MITLRHRFDITKSKQVESLDLSALPFEERNLSELDLGAADCRNANFHDADLSYADLSKTQNLSVDMLAGANLSGAVLPATLPLDSFVSRVDDRIKDTGKFFLVLLGADAYSFLTLLSTQKTLDLKLLTNSADATLPVLNISISLVNFCLVAPLILTLAYFYYLLELQRLWEELARLPYLFPDKRKIHERVYPWFVTFRVTRRSPHYQKTETGAAFPRIQSALLVLLTWWATPLAVSYFWLNMVKTRDSGKLYTLETFLAFCLWWGITTYYASKKGNAPLQKASTEPEERPLLRIIRKVASHPLTLFFLVNQLTFGLAYIVPLFPANRWAKHKNIPYYDVRVWARGLTVPLSVIKYSPYPNLNGADVSTKLTPPVSATIANNIWDWGQQHEDFLRQYQAKTNVANAINRDISALDRTSKQHKNNLYALNAKLERAKSEQANLLQNYLGRVKRADLRNAKLRYIDAERAFMAGADVAGADMRRAVLTEANLIGLRGVAIDDEQPVNLAEAFLRGAKLIGAYLNGAYLTLANLNGAYLSGANLNGAKLTFSNLTSANLTDAKLNNDADLFSANLSGANINGADLTRAIGITKSQILQAKWRKVPKGLPAEWNLPPKHNWTQTDENQWKLDHPHEK